ncbi:TetR family transcriptional regulator [Streptomyces nodosus]|uniref:TetR family transcriptional regulator n=1 Tax=Streptomyces nodosus TaxID=40318 RepID=A0A0B5DAB6_9ACTN|nr:TetR family transcriptional regulator [Streptomyces nodosus]AJE40533.1 TetR family transcriptional regulator [Streptomyces nodosus]MBB4791582.1 AcrR family transcriptional regulator [Streptomyces nodosus]QEV39090.1 TetR family transcriptional regulator [Streptomyces nodosus]
METLPRPGLRERKKQHTRNALLRAALELFFAQGYERTTVDEIAEAVDVSQRTFFRYFAGKEDVVFFTHSVAAAHFVGLVRTRPPEEAPLEALRQAVLEGWDGIGEAVGEIVPVELHLRTYRLIESTPALFATHLRRSAELEEEIARVIAEREGLDVDLDPRPRVAVAVFGGVIRVTERLWSAGGDISVAAIRELTASYLDTVRPVLAEGWHTG